MSDELSIQVNTSASGFHYSTVPMDYLANFGASEQTLAQVVVDISGSTSSFYKELIDSLNMTLEACKKHPRSENVMLRVLTFNSHGVSEIHGFMPVNSIDPTIYQKIATPNGFTPLYQAFQDSLEALHEYAVDLTKNQFSCNAVTFVVTDGEENGSDSRFSVKTVKSMIDKLKQNDPLESFTSILIGINDAGCRSSLIQFKDSVGIDDYKSIEDASNGKLAKLAKFVSQSISTASVSLNQRSSQTVSQQVASLSI